MKKTTLLTMLMAFFLVASFTACRKQDPNLAVIQSSRPSSQAFMRVTSGFFSSDMQSNLLTGDFTSYGIYLYAQESSVVWYSLPTVLFSGSGANLSEHFYYYSISSGILQIFADGDDRTPDIRNFRLVVVKQQDKNLNVDFTDYLAVKAAFNLPDVPVAVIE